MSLAGRLMATLGLDSRGFKKGLNESESRAKRFGRSLARIGASVVATFGGVAASVGRSANVLTELDNQAKLAGVGAEQFKIFTLAASEFGIGQEKVADILKDVNDKFGDYAATGAGPLADFFENIAPKVGVTQKSFENLSSSDALQLYVSSLEKAGVSQQQMTFYMEALASDATALLPVLRNQGEALGAVEARAKALGLTLDQQTIDAARKARSEFGIVSEVLRTRLHVALASIIPFIVGLANALTAAGNAIAPYFSKIVSIAGVLVTVIGVRLATALGVKYVAAAVAAIKQAIALELALGAKSRRAALASLAIKGLNRSLRALRSALIATGIGAFVVGAGLLVDQFVKLVQKSGGFGKALALLADVAKEVFDRIRLAAASGMSYVDAAFLAFKAGAIRVWADVLSRITSAVEKIVDAGVGAAEAFKGAFKQIPGALGDFMFQAVNSVISGVESMINAVIRRVNNFVGSVNSLLAKLPSWAGGDTAKIGLVSEVDLGGVNNPFAGRAGSMGDAAIAAYNAAQGQADFSARTGQLRDLAKAADISAAAARTAGKVFLTFATEPLESVQALKDVLAETGDETDATTDAVAKLEGQLSKLGGGSAGSLGSQGVADKIKDKLAAPFQYLKDRVKDFSDGIAGAIVQSRSLGDAARQVFQRMAQDLLSSGIHGLLGSLFNPGGKSGGGFFGRLLGPLFNFPAYARGTGFSKNGYAQIFEEGGELVNLPTGAQIIPHDLSKRMMDAAGQGAARLASAPVAVGARQGVDISFVQKSLRLSDDGKIVAELEARTDRKFETGVAEIKRSMPEHLASYERDRRVRG